MKIGLVAIVRDEEETLPRLLEQVEPLVDTVTLVDTGSRDRTPWIARNAAKRFGGRLHTRPWRNFAHNRTEALRLAQGTADYHLMLDADHTVATHCDRPEALTADSYQLRVTSAADEWRLPLLTRDGHPFEYRGAAHAYLDSDAPTVSEQLDWLSVQGGGGVTREKLERDLALLTTAFAENPADRRTIFYLAQTHRDLGNIDEAIALYRLRATMGGWDEEVYWARYQAGRLLGEHVSFDAGADELLRAWRGRPHRIEALRALGNLAHSVADKAPVPTEDDLFVRRADYRSAA